MFADFKYGTFHERDQGRCSHCYHIDSANVVSYSVFIQQEKMEVQHQMAGKGALTARVRHRNKRHGLTARRKRNIQLRMRQRRGV